jgi:hypothetical protein
MVTSDWDEIKAYAEELELRICGTLLHDGTPKYFTVDPETDDDEIEDRAFEIREGRPKTAYERWAMQIAKQRKSFAEVAASA